MTPVLEDEVAGWIRRHARPLTDVDALRAIVGDARIVGLGVPTHGARELTALVQQLVVLLVERLGFRALATEDDETVAARLDHALVSGEGDLRALVGGLAPHLRTAEMLDIVRGIRAWNEVHPTDPVRFVGLEPRSEGPPPADHIGHLEGLLAERAVRWHRQTGTRLVYWGGFPHTAVGPSRTVSLSGRPPVAHRNAGSRLRAELGAGYVSIGLTFHHGTVDPGPGPVTVPAPAAGFAEAALDAAGPGPYLLDLGAGRIDPAEPAGPAGAGLAAPAKLRLVGPWYDPADDAGYHMTGGTLPEWFDALVHVREVGPIHALA